MSTIAEATLAPADFALAETFRERPGTEIETVRTVADGTGRVMPYLWATAAETEGLPSVVRADPTTREVEVVAQFDGEYFFRVAWTTRIQVVVGVLVEAGATILDATGTADGWRFRVLVPERSIVADTHDVCEAYDLDLEFRRIYELSDSFRRGQFGLTENQYETIVGAYERGYYDVPREITLEDLAGRMDVSHQALSERLRRGHSTLVERALRPEITAPFQG